MNEEEKEQIIKVIKEFYSIFPKNYDVLTHTSTVQHEIRTTDEIGTHIYQILSVSETGN